jgi:hypothetical protein
MAKLLKPYRENALQQQPGQVAARGGDRAGEGMRMGMGMGMGVDSDSGKVGDNDSSFAEDGSADEAAVGGDAGKREAAEENERNVLAAVDLLRKKRLSVVVLSEDDRDTFLGYNKIARALLTGKEE